MALQSQLPAKRLELLKELLAVAGKVAVFTNEQNTGAALLGAGDGQTAKSSAPCRPRRGTRTTGSRGPPEIQMMDLVRASTALGECSGSCERNFPDRICV
jgi:hypothetical protein